MVERNHGRLMLNVGGVGAVERTEKRGKQGFWGGGSWFGDPAPLVDLKHILVIFSLAVIHIWSVEAIQALAGELVDPSEVL